MVLWLSAPGRSQKQSRDLEIKGTERNNPERQGRNTGFDITLTTCLRAMNRAPHLDGAAKKSLKVEIIWKLISCLLLHQLHHSEIYLMEKWNSRLLHPTISITHLPFHHRIIDLMVHRVSGAIVRRLKEVFSLRLHLSADNVGILCMMIHFSGVLIGKKTDKFYGKFMGFCARGEMEKVFYFYFPAQDDRK